MPRGDGTGPMGEGAMTGRGMGMCAGYDAPGFANVGRGWFGAGRGGRPFGGGRGRVFGGGRGRGWCRYPVWGRPYGYAPASIEDEKRQIENDIKMMQSDLDAMKEYLTELEKKEK